MRESRTHSAPNGSIIDHAQGVDFTRLSEIVRIWLATMTASFVWPASPRRMGTSPG